MILPGARASAILRCCFLPFGAASKKRPSAGSDHPPGLGRPIHVELRLVAGGTSFPPYSGFREAMFLLFRHVSAKGRTGAVVPKFLRSNREESGEGEGPPPRCLWSASADKGAFAYPWISWSAIFGRELACESMATAAWESTWLRTNSVISVATSTSEMRDSAAWRFSA